MKQTGQNKKNRLAHRTATDIEGLLPVLAHDPGKTENKCPRPEDGAAAGDQDKCPSGFFCHNDSQINVLIKPA
jgi:hypothetical protein